MGPFERTTTLTSYTDCMMNLGEDPDTFKELIDALADYKIAVIRKLHSLTGVNSLLLHDDWGSSKATFMSPATWRKVIKPATKRIYDACHELGITVNQHSCGHIQELIGDLVEIGADGVEIQNDCNDVEFINREYGHKLKIRWNGMVNPDMSGGPGGPGGPGEAGGPPPMDSADQRAFDAPPTFLY